MRAFTRLFLSLILCLAAQAAYPYVLIKGRLASATDDTPLAGATVRLLSLPDSTLLAGTYSDKEGLFSVASSRVSASTKSPVKVLLLASYMGYQPIEKHINVRPKEREYDLKDVHMQEDTHLLGEALVSATPPPLLIKEDTVEYYADSYKTQPDATAEDLLKRLPGVEVATDGTITAQGETVQQVYVDGKEFFGKNTQVTTKNLTAEMIESVQVVDMKTEEARLTGIDDGERRKVVNFKLKPKMRRGWFGNAAAAWGKGEEISDRFDGKGLVGYFRGNSQNALVLNANNTNNAGFGDLGNQIMSGSSMRGNRQSGARGDGLNTSWSVGLNLGYDQGNRMRDQNTPLGITGNVHYGGSQQNEESRSHKVNIQERENTEVDNYVHGHNESQNLQAELKYEKSWGKISEGQHRLQFSPSFNFNSTETDDYSESHKYYGEVKDTTLHVDRRGRHISQTQARNEMEQGGYSLSLSGTYSYAKRTSRGRRRSSITLSFSERMNDGDLYSRSYTTYDTAYVHFDRHADITRNTSQSRDSLINQWREEDMHQENYRIRLTHVEPIANRQFVELSAAANISNRYSTQLYHFWDEGRQGWADSINGRSNIDYSSDTWTQNINYTLSASYRMTSEKYNLSMGMDFLPQSQRYTDYYDHTRDYTRHYINYSPRLEYRYNWTRRKNLRITLNGRTSQPSLNQLQARKNQTSATHVSLGNSSLNPSYTTSFSARYRTFNEETYASLEGGLSASASFNNIVTRRWYSEDQRTDTTQSVNLSGVGNLNIQGDLRGSWPFYDNLWYVTSNTNLGYSESDGYIARQKSDSQLNTSRNYTASQRAGIAYRGEKLNVEVRGNYRIQHAMATLRNVGNLGTTHQYGVSANLTARLPYDFTLSSDFNYTGRHGYSAALSRHQSIWNAQLSRTFLQKKNLTAFVKVFDLLQQKSAISRSVTATAVTDRESTVLGQYFLLGASIRFNRMGQKGGTPRRPSGNGEFQERPFRSNSDWGGSPAGGERHRNDD